MQIYLVGGAVRDRLLGLPVTDRDWVVVGATPDDMFRQSYRKVGRDFPVFLHPDNNEEYALARTERKTGPGYHGFRFHASPEVTLEEDLARRDLTINAIAEDENGELHDPFGGQIDLEHRVLRHVSPAFAEDPVRILRVARFAARFAKAGFSIADETMTLMREMVKSGEASALVPERVWQETGRALTEASPSVFFEVLRDCGALAVIFPEIDRLFGVPQPEKWHPEIDTGIHTMMVLDMAANLSDEPRVRFAALVHDLGKGETPSKYWPAHRGHEERSVALVKDLCGRLRTPTDYRDLAILVARYHGNCHRAFELKASTIQKMLESAGAYRDPEKFSEMLLACEADYRGRTGFEERAYPQAAYLNDARAAAAAIGSDQIDMAKLDGPEIGEKLRKLRSKAINEVKKQGSETGS